MQHMMDTNMDYFLIIFYPSFLIQKLQVEQLKMRIFQTENYLKNYTNQLLENLRKEKYTRLL